MSYESSGSLQWLREINSLRGEISDLRESIRSLEGDISILRQSVRDIQSEVSEVQSREASMLSQLESMREDIKTTKMEVFKQLEKTYEKVSEGLSRTNQRVDTVAHSIDKLEQQLSTALRKNQERLDTLESQLTSGLQTLQVELKKEIKASNDSIIEKTAEINERILTLHLQSTQALSTLLEESKGIRTSVNQVAEGTLTVVRTELSQQTQAQEARMKELQQSFNNTSDKIHLELYNFMENLKQEFESTKKEVNKKIDELGSKTLATAYDVATVVAFLEALRNDINKALDSAIASVDLCYEKNLINQIMKQ